METVADESRGLLWVKRISSEDSSLLVLSFAAGVIQSAALPFPGDWKVALDSSAPRWDGPGSILPERLMEQDRLSIRPRSVALFTGPGTEELR